MAEATVAVGAAVLVVARQRVPLKDALAGRPGTGGAGGGRDRPQLPLMVWYGMEPLCQTTPDRAAGLLEKVAFRS